MINKILKNKINIKKNDKHAQWNELTLHPPMCLSLACLLPPSGPTLLSLCSRRSISQALLSSDLVTTFWASLVVQTVKNLTEMREIRVRSLGWEDPLEEGMAAQSSILAWRIPWTEEPGGLQSMGSQRVRHDRETFTFTFDTEGMTEVEGQMEGGTTLYLSLCLCFG